MHSLVSFLLSIIDCQKASIPFLCFSRYHKPVERHQRLDLEKKSVAEKKGFRDLLCTIVIYEYNIVDCHNHKPSHAFPHEEG